MLRDLGCIPSCILAAEGARVPAMYLTHAFLAILAAVAERGMNNLRVRHALTSADGKTISNDCSACHNLLAVQEENPKILSDLGIRQGALEAVFPLPHQPHNMVDTGITGITVVFKRREIIVSREAIC